MEKETYDKNVPLDGSKFQQREQNTAVKVSSEEQRIEILARETDNSRYKPIKGRYREFLRMTRQWRHLQMLKRAGRGHDPAGINSTKPGELALLCPACPQPGKNLPADWENMPHERKFLYALFLAMDANFRLKRKDVSTEEKDPGLCKGWGFFCEVMAYMDHVKANWHRTQERSHCVSHDAVDKPDREARGTASSGIGAVDCARHNMKRPNAVGDLQLGERYMNMDYMFFMSIAGSTLVRFFVSYDIACQWHINIATRMRMYQNEALMIDGVGKYMVFLVPKFHLPAHIEACNLKYSFNLTRWVGRTDGEAPERGWANTNPLARSTKEMGPGSRRDTLEDHFNDSNWKKIIAFGFAMLRKIRNAVPEMVKTKVALQDLDDSLGSEPVEEWTAMAEAWEEDVEALNPFETVRKDSHLAQVRFQLAEDAAKKEREGTMQSGEVRSDMHITELIAVGLQLEDQQRVVGSDVAATGLHPTDNQRRAMVERTSKLRRKIVGWMDVQQKFYPRLQAIREEEDQARALAAESEPVPGVNVSEIALWLPSAMAKASATMELTCPNEVLGYEYSLRVAQAHESLDEVRRLLLVRTHMYKLKDTHARGVKANTRSQDKITALNDRINRAAEQYRVARRALVTLGRVLKKDEWKSALQELKADDVRGLPRATFSDPERQKKRGKSKAKRARIQRKERPMSWIWIVKSDASEPGSSVAMNEAVRIEWARARARCMRWGEEVDLLEEEMRRILEFMGWRAGWWREQIGRRQLEEGPQLEGETAYALRQAALQITLRDRFALEWKDVPDLIRRGRAGELDEDDLKEDDVKQGAGEGSDRDGEDEDEDEDEEEAESSSDEDEPISSVAPREVKSAYVDEVLTYV
ncbi:hypothetical protein C8R43DRAFT_1144448 [Mycena crocata]|nr:hypothetical protein C8R43DRAFT_1144448 [Mycena crocata]